MSNEVNNAANALGPEGAEPPVPIHRPPETEGPAPRSPNVMESVDTEVEIGPTDLTGHTDQPEAEGIDTPEAGEAPPVESPPAKAPRRPAATRSQPKVAEAEPESTQPEEETPVNRQWYILKVQTNREESIRDALQRRVAMAGLEKYVGDIIVPTEMISEFKGGKKRVSKRKLYPGYIVVNMEINDDTWYLVRETSGIGDFTGAMGRPTPMAPEDVAKIVAKTEEKPDEAPRVDIRFKPSDRVRIKEGTFENFEGNVEAIDQANGRVTVMINIFGRSTPVELEYWQIEGV
ncbi:MAG: transcription termination/antitermination protein NusG [Pirellulales bacterium]